MVPAPDDWRRMRQEDYLTGLAFTLTDYKVYSANWDHDHCEFCFKKFLDPSYADWMRDALAKPSDDHAGSGYANVAAGDTPSARYWVCRECFDDFRPEFGWELVAS